MKILLDGRYLMDMETLNKIQEVEKTGPYNEEKYTVKGEPSGVTLITDASIVCAEEFVEKKEQSSAKELETVRKQLAEMQLDKCRDKVRTKILEENPACKGSILEEFLLSSTYSWIIERWTLVDYKCWKLKEDK